MNPQHNSTGEAAALVTAQRQMPFVAVWAALDSVGAATGLCVAAAAAPAQPAGAAKVESAATSSKTLDPRPLDPWAPLWGHAPLAAVLLRQPQAGSII